MILLKRDHGNDGLMSNLAKPWRKLGSFNLAVSQAINGKRWDNSVINKVFFGKVTRDVQRRTVD